MDLKKPEFKEINILVIGDTGTDEFIYGSALRLAPEAPVPVFNPEKHVSNPGMAGNVSRNLKALGSNVFTMFNQGGKITKTRYVDKRTGQMLFRIDSNDKAKHISKDVLNRIKNNRLTVFDPTLVLEYSIPSEEIDIDAIIISDYDKGFLKEEDIEYICNNNDNVFIDTKKILDDWCKNASFIKINHVEYERSDYTIDLLDIEDKLIITHSNKGCVYKGKSFPVKKVPIKDVSGAGDTFISGLVLEYVLSKDIEKAIKFAQECATVVVQKQGISTV